MTTFIAPPIEPNAVAELSDTELERELTLATLTSAREPTFNILLTERKRRRREGVRGVSSCPARSIGRKSRRR
jgi:hypothetical protein